jgi:hypothetical protein
MNRKNIIELLGADKDFVESLTISGDIVEFYVTYGVGCALVMNDDEWGIADVDMGRVANTAFQFKNEGLALLAFYVIAKKNMMYTIHPEYDDVLRDVYQFARGGGHDIGRFEKILERAVRKEYFSMREDGSLGTVHFMPNDRGYDIVYRGHECDDFYFEVCIEPERAFTAYFFMCLHYQDFVEKIIPIIEPFLGDNREMELMLLAYCWGDITRIRSKTLGGLDFCKHRRASETIEKIISVASMLHLPAIGWLVDKAADKILGGVLYRNIINDYIHAKEAEWGAPDIDKDHLAGELRRMAGG